MIAKTNRAIRVNETAGSPVYYIPRDDIHMKFLEPDEKETLQIAYTDRCGMVYSMRDDDSWLIQEVPHHTDQFLGQLVELELDADDKPHLIWYEVENFAPLISPLIHASGS